MRLNKLKKKERCNGFDDFISEIIKNKTLFYGKYLEVRGDFYPEMLIFIGSLKRIIMC